MATYSVMNAAGAGISSARFFQPGATLMSTAATSYRVENPDGTIVDIVGTGFTFDGADIPTGGTVDGITLYQSDFTVQLAGFALGSVSLVDLYATWLGATPGDVFAFLLPGNDTVFGNVGNDILTGGAGDDTITGGDGNDVIEPGAGTDAIDGETGQNRVRYDREALFGGTAGITASLATGVVTDPYGQKDQLTRIQAITGTDKADTLSGGDSPLLGGNAYEIYALGGDDTITGGAFDLYVEPGAGNDTIKGGAGFDQVSYAEYKGAGAAVINLATGKVSDPYGGTDTILGSIEGARGTPNADTMTGNGADNFFRGLGGADIIDGGTGIDQVRYDRDAQYGGTKGVVVDLAAGTALDGFGTVDKLTSIENARGSAQGDSLFGNGSANNLQGLGGNDILNGGGGNDTADFSVEQFFGGTKGVTVDLAAGTATDSLGGKDTLASIEIVRGTKFADTLLGGNVALPGTDIYALNGLEGDDTLTAGAYDSVLSPGAGNDVVKGGAGFDQISYEEYTGDAGAVINLKSGIVNDPFGGTDTVSLVEGVRGTRNADTITGNDGNNFFRGLAGNDKIDGGAGTDQVRYDRDAQLGGNGNIFVNLLTGFATDGFGNTDTLTSIENARGSNNNDDLRGDANNNAFQPLGGADFIGGGDGQDTVDYSADTLNVGFTGVTVNLTTLTGIGGDGLADTLSSIEAARGSNGNDTLVGGKFALVNQAYELYGLAGNDTITAGTFDTYVEPGAGNDTITGGTGFDQVSYQEYAGTKGVDANLSTGIAMDPYGGKDTLGASIEGLRGTRNADTLVGNDGNNQFRGLNGSDFISGGLGQDRVRYDRDAQFGGTKGVVVNLGKGTATDGFGNADTLVSIEQVEGSAFGDTLTGGDAGLGPGTSWELFGRNGDDTLTGGAASLYAEPGAGNDTVKGGSGVADQIGYADFSNGVGITLDMTKGSVVDPLGGTDTFTGIENVRGTGFADSITGDGGANQLTGLKGADLLDGGLGLDMARYDRDTNYGGGSPVTVDLAAGTAVDGFATTDTLKNIENVRGTNATFGDDIRGDGGDNLFQGLRGNDRLEGRGGLDTVDYSRDVADGGANGVKVQLGPVTVGQGTATDGFGNADTLIDIENAVGSQFADILTGDAGANMLQGGLGDDTLDGKDGIDTAVFAGNAASYSVVAGVGGVLTVTGADGKDTVSNVEFLKFADLTAAVGTATFSVAAVTTSVAEGTGAGTTAFTMKITRAGGTALTQGIAWSVAGVAGSGTAPADAGDFAGNVLPSGSVTFAPGETEKLITVPVLRDGVVEQNDRFAVALGAAPAGGAIGTGSAQGIILNDDTTYAISSKLAQVAEGGAGNSTQTVTVTRSGNLSAAGSVGYMIAGIGPDAIDSADILTGPTLPMVGTLSFAAGQSTASLGIAIAGDAVAEANETFQVTLSNPVGGTIATPSVTQTILNDDTTFSIAPLSAGKPEGTGGPGATTPFTFTVARTGTPGAAQTVAWTVAGAAGTGTQPADAADFAGGVLPSGVLTFAAGEASKPLTINVAADALGELADRFAVTLANPSNGAVLGTASAQGVIQNDDTSLRVVAGGPMTQTEGNTGPRGYVFVVQRQGTTTGASTVDYAVAGIPGAAADAADFTGGVLPSGTVSFAAGETSKTVFVNVAGDTALEGDESFLFTLSNPSGAAISTPTLGATIQSDDSLLSISAASANKPEGTGPAGATTQFTFTVTRSGATGVSQGVAFSVAGVAGNGTVPATAPDFATGVFPTGSVNFAAGQTTRTITINVRADEAAELNERFAVTLNTATGGAQIDSLKSSAQGIIQTDDYASTAANQTLNGTAAPDLFLLGGGIDSVFGKGGVDSFRFLPAALGNGATNATTIEDFNPAAGEKLDLSRIDAIAATLADDAFTFNPTAGAGFSGAGSLVWQLDGTRVAIIGDTNGDFAADLTLFVRPVATPDATWFIL